MGPTERISKAHHQRFETMREIGCLISLVYFGKGGTPGTVHHIVEGGKRLGHQFTLYLSPWFHQGQPPMVIRRGEPKQLSQDQATHLYGPSLELDRLAFEARFGTQRELLAMQDDLITTWTSCAALT
jgi:hypothetical protein